MSFLDNKAAVRMNKYVTRYKDADSIFFLGIARKAEPLNRLKKRRDAFQARMLISPPVEDSDTSSTPPSSRNGLGASTSRSQPLAASSSQGIRPTPNGALFSVFTDTGADENGVREGTWEDLGTRDSRRRENHKDATTWKGETLSTSIGPSAGLLPGGEKLMVFRDDVSHGDTSIVPLLIYNRTRRLYKNTNRLVTIKLS